MYEVDEKPGPDYRRAKESVLQHLSAGGDVAATRELERRGLELSGKKESPPEHPRKPRERRIARSRYFESNRVQR